MFDALLKRIDEEIVRRLFRIGVNQNVQEIPVSRMRENIDKKDATGLAADSDSSLANSQQPKTNSKLGRNDPCFCGSGKKWKHCHYPQYG